MHMESSEQPMLVLLWKNARENVIKELEQPQTDAHTDTARLKEKGELAASLFDSILRIFADEIYKKNSRNINIYIEYIESDSTTLADLAQKHGVSRERIRQIGTKAGDRLPYQLKRTMYYRNEKLHDCIKRLLDVFEEINYDVISLAAIGMNEVSNRKKHQLFEMLFGENAADAIMKAVLSYKKSEAERIKTEFQMQESDAAWKKFYAKICFPSSRVADNTVTPLPYNQESELTIQKKLEKKLEGFAEITKIIPTPNIVYHTTSTTDHRPSLLLRLSDGTSVLVLILPTINMSYIYNVERANSLHSYCKQHGYGYLITDDRNNSIYDLMHREICPELEEKLNEILKISGKIMWSDVKEIKKTHPVSNEDISAYVLQNKLSFTMSPFIITRRKKP